MLYKLLTYLVAIAATVLSSWITLNICYPGSPDVVYGVLSLIGSVFVVGSLWGYKTCTINFCISVDYRKLARSQNVQYLNDISSCLMRFSAIWALGSAFTIVLGKGSKLQGIVTLATIAVNILTVQDKSQTALSSYYSLKRLYEEAEEAERKHYYNDSSDI